MVRYSFTPSNPATNKHYLMRRRSLCAEKSARPMSKSRRLHYACVSIRPQKRYACFMWRQPHTAHAHTHTHTFMHMHTCTYPVSSPRGRPETTSHQPPATRTQPTEQTDARLLLRLKTHTARWSCSCCMRWFLLAERDHSDTCVARVSATTKSTLHTYIISVCVYACVRLCDGNLNLIPWNKANNLIEYILEMWARACLLRERRLAWTVISNEKKWWHILRN